MKFNKILTFFTIWLLITACGQPSSSKKTIIIKGSDTMVNLTQNWAEAYMVRRPEVSIQVTGGGSGTGIAALLNGSANVANISRELKEDEIRNAKQRGVRPLQHKVALDGIAVVVNPQNTVEALTTGQIADIFSGKIKNWKEVGGPDLKIVLYGRENSSGTYEYFREAILGRTEKGKAVDFSTSAQSLQGTAALGETIARDKRGIGYGGVGYFANRKDLKVISLQTEKNAKAISPVIDGRLNYEVVWSGEYPLSRYLYCYTDGKPDSVTNNYIDFITSKKGQQIVIDMGYVPLPGVNTPQ